MRQTLAAFLAAFLAVNALAMMLASSWWYAAVPRIAATGPFNAHFIKDIGAAYLAAAGGLGWFAIAPRQGWPALLAATAFLVLHALIHLADAAVAGGASLDLAVDFPGVFAPALIALIIAVTARPAQERGENQS